MKIERAFRNERLLKALTGVGIEEFKELEVAFERDLNRIKAYLMIYVTLLSNPRFTY